MAYCQHLFFLLIVTTVSPISFSHSAWDTFYFLLDPFAGCQSWDLPGAVASRICPVSGILLMYMGFLMPPPNNLSWEECLLLKETSGSQLSWLKNFHSCLLNWQLENWFSVNSFNFYYWISSSYFREFRFAFNNLNIFYFCLCVTYWICIMRFESMTRGKEPLK